VSDLVTTQRDVMLPTYRVTISNGGLARVGEIVRDTAPAHRYAIVTDSNVGPRYATGVRDTLDKARSTVFTIPAGEAHKTRDTWALLTDELLASGFGRDTTIIAATFMRGVPYVQVPTSLLAMIDASVGGKTGVDTVAGKNLVGAFHQPAAVVADTSVLATLPRGHLRAGLAEAIKHGVIADAAYFESVCQFASSLSTADVTGDAMLDLVARSVEIKADVVRRDEREDGVRKTLNFGHTIGHAVELCSNYTLLHGDGMAYESVLAERLGVAESGTASRVRAAVQAAGLPVARPSSIAIADVVAAARGDKKARGGQAEYALPARIGAMAAAHSGWSVPVSESLVAEVLEVIA
jgi:3-dehydroquinate synthase